MRCPKCGYISFDTLGTCKKCNKAIGDLLDDFEGTVFEATAPSFLHIRSAGTMVEAQVAEAEEAVDLLEDEPEVDGISFGDDPFADEDVLTEDMELDDEEGTVGFAEVEEVEIAEEILFEETAIEEEETVPSSEEKETDLELDFGDIDISDLAPPADDQNEAAPGEMELDEPVQEEESLAMETPSATSTTSAPSAASSGLEDLQVEDLDLDAPAPLVTGSKVGDKLMPSVKTGTALDDFDVDLGELISKK